MQLLLKNGKERIVNRKLCWIVSAIFSIALCLVIGGMWYIADSDYNPNDNQLISMYAAEADLIVKLKQTGRYEKSDKAFIPTGIFIQSLNFNNSSDVNITGYVWQKYPIDNKLVNPEQNPGFIFPEQVDSGSNINPQLIYEDVYEDIVIYGWYFEATLRQEFDYQKYPLDHKTVWIRIWPADFQRTQYLIPALDNYQSTSPGVPFGLDKKIVLGSWNIKETFYDYKITEYDSNFGLDLGSTQNAYPELYFNIVLKRKFLNSFIVEVVPLLTVAVLIFSLVMTISHDPLYKERMGFDVNTIIGVISALFFVVMLSHIHIRQQFPSQGVVYIEYFFLIMYMTMVVIIIDTFIFSWSTELNLVTFADNLIAKLTFWPVTLGLMTIVTYVFLF